MNLSHLKDQELHLKVKSLDAEEKRLVVEILHHLLEVDRRRLFSVYGHSSLFQYTVKELGYSEDQAYRRINSMRALCSLPEIEEKIESGALNITTLSLAQNFFKESNLTKEEKLVIVETLENKSKREVEKILSPEKEPEMKFKLSPELQKKIEKLRGLKAHSAKSLEELIELMADLALKEWDPAQTKVKERKQTPAPGRKSRVIPAKEKRAVWKKHEGRCANCKSQHALEIDHIIPYAWGGLTEEKNLRLLCRACNQRHAIEKLGLKKMAPYLSSV